MSENNLPVNDNPFQGDDIRSLKEDYDALGCEYCGLHECNCSSGNYDEDYDDEEGGENLDWEVQFD